MLVARENVSEGIDHLEFSVGCPGHVLFWAEGSVLAVKSYNWRILVVFPVI